MGRRSQTPKHRKPRTAEKAQLIIRNEFPIEWILKQENLLSVTVHAYNLSNWKAEAEGLQ